MLNDKIYVIREPKDEEWGIWLKQKVTHPSAFSTLLDIEHVFIEEYKADKIYTTKKPEIGKSIMFNTEDIDSFIKGLKRYIYDSGDSKEVIGVELVKPSANGKYKDEKTI